MNILHISDVHFGARDSIAEQPRITEALIEAIQNHGKQPDLCIFSGDLANQGKTTEFAEGEDWLRRLLKKEWKCSLIVVPGNHDINRTPRGAKVPTAMFRAIAREPDAYSDWSQAKTVECEHLQSFFKWHAEASTRLPMLGQWDSPFGFHVRADSDAMPVHVICMNSATFCCDDKDEKNLVIDTRTLNAKLELTTKQPGLVIVIAHHPLGFLVPWNRSQVETILSQERGAHLFLHGHLHEAQAYSQADSAGSGLTTLAAGAAYQTTQWPQSFTFYELEFEKREVMPRPYVYNSKRGYWDLDTSRSRPIVTRIPQRIKGAPIEPREPIANTATSTTPSASNSNTSVQNGPSPGANSTFPAGTATSSRLAVDGDQWWPDGEDYGTRGPETAKSDFPEGRAAVLLLAATSVQPRILQYLGTLQTKSRDWYALRSRLKSPERIREKFDERITKDPNYQIESMPDVCAFRIITKYQDAIPLVLEKLLQEIEALSQECPFLHDRLITIEVNNSRTEFDSLSLVEPVSAICKQSKLKPEFSIKARDTGYSSIHFVATVPVISSGFSVKEIRVEVQIRSALEDVWGEIDHDIDYRFRRGRKDVPRNRHLNVFKGLIDNLISYVDLIKKQTEASAKPTEAAVSRSVNDPRDQLRRLRDLPREMYERVEQVFRLWSQANDSRKSGVPNPVLYQNGAKAFAVLRNDYAGKPENNPALAADLSYICSLEYAYLLQFTSDPADTRQAEQVYTDILRERPADVTANYRLGALYRRIGALDKSIEHLEKSLSGITNGRDSYIDKEHWVFDSLRREIGITQWRISEDKKRLAEVRRAALLVAMRQAYDVIVRPAVKNGPRIAAINDFLYYHWFESVLAPGQPSSFNSVKQAELKTLADELFRYYETSSKSRRRYNWLDTLLRISSASDLRAKQIARDLQEEIEKEVRRQYPDLELSNTGTIQWFAELLPRVDSDRQDALTYAQDFLARDR